MSDKKTLETPAPRVEITWTPDALAALKSLHQTDAAVQKRAWNAALKLAARECLSQVQARGEAATWAQRHSSIPWSIDATFVCDAEMRELNARFRAKDRPTDVLSFSQAESGASAEIEVETEDEFEASEQPESEASDSEDELPFAWPGAFGEAGEAALGDLVIAIETAHRQAGERAHSGAVEVLFLSIHGTLHLLGYDHQTSSQRVAMWREQEALFEKLRPKVEKSAAKGPAGCAEHKSGENILEGS
jgi:probable rRNA maturation factor